MVKTYKNSLQGQFRFWRNIFQRKKWKIDQVPMQKQILQHQTNQKIIYSNVRNKTDEYSSLQFIWRQWVVLRRVRSSRRRYLHHGHLHPRTEDCGIANLLQSLWFKVSSNTIFCEMSNKWNNAKLFDYFLTFQVLRELITRSNGTRSKH